MKNGEICTAFPPEFVKIENGEHHQPGAFPEAIKQ
jgi:hypothetical protein